MITLKQARHLKRGDILVDTRGKRWKVNGQVQLWKTMPDRIRVPLKHGLYAYDAITELDFAASFDGSISGNICHQLTLESEMNK